MSDPTTVHARVAALMPALLNDLERLVTIPSIATPGFPAEPLHAAHDLVAEMLREAGVETVEALDLDGQVSPVVIGRIPAPPGAPTVLLYTHYDVVPPGDLDLWETAPFEPVERAGAIHGRGAADSKADVVAIAGALRLFGGRPPVGVTVVVEGAEEVGGPFEHHPLDDPEAFACDAMVIADVGNVRPGEPTLTVALRGSAQVTVEVRTLAGGGKHSGMFGGAAPDARLALIRLLATLHDENGDVVVPGLRRVPWTGATYTDDEFRDLAEVLDGVPLQGTGGLSERIWSGPAITVVAFDAPPTTAPLNAVASSAKAVLNLRVHPEQDAREAQAALAHFLETQRPFGIPVTVTVGETGNGFAAASAGPAYAAAIDALGAAWGAPTQHLAAGGSIPIVNALAEAVPAAEVLLFGAIDGYANIHAPNERVLISEVEKTTVAIAIFLEEFAGRWGNAKAE